MKTSIDQKIKEIKTYMRWLELEIIESVGDETRKGFVSHALVKIKKLAVELEYLTEKSQISSTSF